MPSIRKRQRLVIKKITTVMVASMKVVSATHLDKNVIVMKDRVERQTRACAKKVHRPVSKANGANVSAPSHHKQKNATKKTTIATVALMKAANVFLVSKRAVTLAHPKQRRVMNLVRQDSILVCPLESGGHVKAKSSRKRRRVMVWMTIAMERSMTQPIVSAGLLAPPPNATQVLSAPKEKVFVPLVPAVAFHPVSGPASVKVKSSPKRRPVTVSMTIVTDLSTTRASVSVGLPDKHKSATQALSRPKGRGSVVWEFSVVRLMERGPNHVKDRSYLLLKSATAKMTTVTEPSMAPLFVSVGLLGVHSSALMVSPQLQGGKGFVRQGRKSVAPKASGEHVLT